MYMSARPTMGTVECRRRTNRKSQSTRNKLIRDQTLTFSQFCCKKVSLLLGVSIDPLLMLATMEAIRRGSHMSHSGGAWSSVIVWCASGEEVGVLSTGSGSLQNSRVTRGWKRGGPEVIHSPRSVPTAGGRP